MIEQFIQRQGWIPGFIKRNAKGAAWGIILGILYLIIGEFIIPNSINISDKVSIMQGSIPAWMMIFVIPMFIFAKLIFVIFGTWLIPAIEAGDKVMLLTVLFGAGFILFTMFIGIIIQAVFRKK